jgi:hypothetical protein
VRRAGERSAAGYRWAREQALGSPIIVRYVRIINAMRHAARADTVDGRFIGVHGVSVSEASMEQILPGTFTFALLVAGARQANGMLAERVTVGKNGFAPPL